MGLTVCLGYLADMKQLDEESYASAKELFTSANAVLAAEGLPPYDEPESTNLPERRSCWGFPTGCLHYLRRAFALYDPDSDELLAPVLDGNVEADDDLVEEASSVLDSHLLCHSDSSGLYVPVDFPEPIFPEDERAVPGGMLGSSYGLLRELVEVAPYIGVSLDADGSLSDSEAQRIDSLSTGRQPHPFYNELMVWFALYEAACISIEHRTAIVFA